MMMYTITVVIKLFSDIKYIFIFIHFTTNELSDFTNFDHLFFTVKFINSLNKQIIS